MDMTRTWIQLVEGQMVQEERKNCDIPNQAGTGNVLHASRADRLEINGKGAGNAPHKTFSTLSFNRHPKLSAAQVAWTLGRRWP